MNHFRYHYQPDKLLMLDENGRGTKYVWFEGRFGFYEPAEYKLSLDDCYFHETVDLEALRNVAAYNKNQLPVQEGYIYFLFKGQEVVYVGQTFRLRKRITEHCKGEKVFDSWAYLVVKESDIDNLEFYYIAKHKPKYNRSLPICERFKRLKDCESHLGVSPHTAQKLMSKVQDGLLDWQGEIYIDLFNAFCQIANFKDGLVDEFGADVPNRLELELAMGEGR